MPPANWIPPLAELAKRISYGGVISGNEVCLYRQAGSMLSSVVNFWPGYAGLQVVPWMAVADVLPVWTESGRVFQNWLDKKSPIVHTHLPHVIQDDNIALIVYKPLVPLLAGVFGDVALNWPDSKFDETRFESMASAGFLKTAIGTVGRWIRGISGHQGSWVLGRKGDSYVAVFRPCGEKKQKGWYACNGVNGRQVWATAVGDSNLYGDFDAFATIVGAATVKESFRWRFGRSPVYETSLTIDGKTVSHDWL